jgi:hypothetical protein
VKVERERDEDDKQTARDLQLVTTTIFFFFYFHSTYQEHITMVR